MRHKDKETLAEALEDWKRLRAKVAAEGGENYEQPVVVHFLDRNTFEVMDRDIVEDEFYVLRKHRILRDLDPQGKDLDEAIRNARGAGRPTGRQQPQRTQRPSRRVRGGRPDRGQRKQGEPRPQGEQRADGEQRQGGNRRRRRRGGRKGHRRGGGGTGGVKPAAP
ncbi:MAG: hypothetical protein KF696_15925 [Planctomycetes bacterium]|nr:hypothetical protein [Planctomycetota bacterium]MCW8136912.1 hypothetical protein [Planctomycetota bacterium]